jgi:DNA-binding NarL/FixJ family response regulator
MDTPYKKEVRQKTKVTVLSTYKLISDYLNALLQDDKEMAVLDIAASPNELLQSVKNDAPDVVLICLMDSEGSNVSVISELFECAPNSKVVLLASPDSQLDQPAALKLGVTGIVGTNQSPRMLIRAIRQVSEGEIWLNQKLVEQLLGESLHTQNGRSNGNGYQKLHELTNRELEVIAMVGRGMNNKDISSMLFISEATVRHHLSSIYSKLHVEDRLNLAIYAYQHKIVVPPASVV